jgi:hypothetical protein
VLADTRLVFSIRYARALLKRKAWELGSNAALARQVGQDYGNFCQRLKGICGNENNLGVHIERFLGVKPVTIYVPKAMSDQEIDQRLALARAGTLPRG